MGLVAVGCAVIAGVMMKAELTRVGTHPRRIERLNVREDGRVAGTRVLETERPLERWKAGVGDRDAADLQACRSVGPRERPFRTPLVERPRASLELPRRQELERGFAVVHERERRFVRVRVTLLRRARGQVRKPDLAAVHERDLRVHPVAVIARDAIGRLFRREHEPRRAGQIDLDGLAGHALAHDARTELLHAPDADGEVDAALPPLVSSLLSMPTRAVNSAPGPGRITRIMLGRGTEVRA